MKVRGWLIVGGQDAAKGLPLDASLGYTTSFDPEPPDASQVKPGQWIIWAPTGISRLTLVCVEVPL